MKKKDNSDSENVSNISPTNENKKRNSDATNLPWYKKTWGKTIIILILVFILGKQILGLGSFLFLVGIVALTKSITSLIKKKKTRINPLITLIIGVILLPIGGNLMPDNTNSNAQSAKVQKVKHKEKKNQTKKAKKHSKAQKHKNIKKVPTHVVTKPKHNKQHKTKNNSSNNSQQVASDQNNQGENNLVPQKGYVFIAPDHGKRYHFNPGCRGLRNADNITKITLAEAKAQGYTQCQIDSDIPE
ncbi:hypothetical protein OZX69_05955 [Lactobacillus sp. ESL0731]|uniref:hypothetical protein n=1 Tax=unclassified Lactobacillus TaxID=2620435 RepID=UPI0023F7ED53|nr:MULTISPECIES: hypothetical protein [unclassified Lactobacillus]WEV50505.1 hypothetical protein OZX63_05950 [Lactobacillus sp. ESL0700]WEV61635.1 hypothetical protein OZX69_05955 [Lactobacillus sp. ESL0731]